jgi:hypothetical protein
MYIYTDVFSGDELFSDCYPIEQQFGGTLYVVTAKMVTKDEGGDYGIEGDDVDTTAAAIKVINVVDAHNLIESQWTKKDYVTHIKTYVRELKKKLVAAGQDTAAFEAGAQAAVAHILKVFSQLSFYSGNSVDTKGMVIPCLWEGETPNFYFWVHGVTQSKV